MIKIYHRTATNYDIDDPQLDFTSMLDVIFIILVFTVLMINTSSLLELQVKLPEAHGEQRSETNLNDDLLIEITSKGEYIAGGNKYLTLQELKSYLLKVNSQKRLKIASDENAAAKNLVKLLALLNEINVNTSEILLKKY
jgi:biopolymer transport protein ExbD